MSKSKSKGMKRGSQQYKDHMAEIDAKAYEEREVRAHGNRQMMADAIALAAHEQLGFSGKRIIRFVSAVSRKLDEICRTVTSDYKNDKKFEYAKADYDKALQQAFGRYYTVLPFELRFCPEGWQMKDGDIFKKIAEEVGVDVRPFNPYENTELYKKAFEEGKAAAEEELGKTIAGLERHIEELEKELRR